MNIMATIKTLLLSDLVIGETYFLFWGDRLYWKVIFLGVVDQYGTANLEIVVAQILRKKWKSINMPYCSEIGIGKTKAQSRTNYGTFKNQTVSNAYKTRDDTQHENRKYLKPFEYKSNLNDPFYK
jgi:hypothetical protein